MRKSYKGKIIEVEDKESPYFYSFSGYPKKDVEENARKEMKKSPILTRYEIIKKTFSPTSAYPRGIMYEARFFYHRPMIDYYDYGTDVQKAKSDLAEFKRNKDKPLYSYPVSSVERNMFHASIEGALSTIKASKRVRDEIMEIFKHRASITPYTNWSGD